MDTYAALDTSFFPFWGEVKMSFEQAFSLALYFTCSNGQVMITTYVAPCPELKVFSELNIHSMEKCVIFILKLSK